MFDEVKSRAQIAYESRDYKKALGLYEELKNIDINKFEKQCIFNYMWCLYRVKINIDDAFENHNVTDDAKGAIKYILEHQSNRDLLFQLVVFRVLKELKKKQNFEADKINIWLDKLNPDLLSEEPVIYKYEGKQIVSASNKEEWYALKSKACEKLENYGECIRISQEALNKIKELHNGNDIWFKRRIAISKSKLGQISDALDILLNLLKFKRDWFIYKDIGDIYLMQDNCKDAIDYYISAILALGDDDKKVNLFWETANLLNQMGDIKGEALLKSYSIKLRIDNNWSLGAEEKEFYGRNKDLIESAETKILRNKVLKLAKEYKWKDSDKLEGYISKIMPDNKAGFIKTGEKSYYFKMNEIKDRKKDVQAGMKVSFFIEKGFDKKKGKETDIAVNISIIE